MVRTLSVGMMKLKGPGLKQRIPREGTKLRAIWDLFQANPGVPFQHRFSADDSTRICLDLHDYYGLDIRCLRRDKRTGRMSTYVLAGEWFGRVYVDYIAERLKEKEDGNGTET